MSIQYLHFNIFGMALADMAADTGSISRRLSDAYMNFLYKLEWEKDIEFIPEIAKVKFWMLKKILSDDMLITMEANRAEIKKHHSRHKTPITEQELGMYCNPITTIRDMHWKKSKKAAELIGEIFFDLGRELQR